jgi:hypothetical protein
MRRFRLSTLMLLIVIVALSIALVVQQQRAGRREAKLQNDVEVLTRIEARLQKLMQKQAEKLRLAEEQQRITGGKATNAGVDQ